MRGDVSNVELGLGWRRRERGIDEQAADVDGGAVAGGGDLQPALDGLRALRNVDDAQGVQHVLAVAALAAAALGLGEDPDALVVADVRCAQPGAATCPMVRDGSVVAMADPLDFKSC